jgi:hypothetical protein
MVGNDEDEIFNDFIEDISVEEEEEVKIDI